MKKLLYTIAFAICLPTLTNAQYADGLSEISMFALRNLDPNSQVYIMSNHKNKVVGTQYKNGEWTKGQIRLKEIDAFSEVVEILLNLEDHRMYFRFLDTPDRIGELSSAEVAAAKLFLEKGDTLYYEVHDLNRRIREAPLGVKFYQILHAGDYVLLHLEDRYMRREAYIENLGMVRRPDEYKSRDAYYLIKGRRFHQMGKNLKSFEKAFPRYRRHLKDLAKENKLKLSREDDFAKMVALIEMNEPRWTTKRKN